MNTLHKANKNKTQYFKVIDVKNGHHGFHYKVGMNTDLWPEPLETLNNCAPGALYFTDVENLHHYNDFGSKLAWVKPASDYVLFSQKGATHNLIVEKMLPMRKAIDEISGYRLALLRVFHIRATYERVMRACDPIEEKYKFILDNLPKFAMKFILDNRNNRRLIEYIKGRWEKFKDSEIEILLANDLLELLNYKTMSELIRRKKWDLLRKIVQKDIRLLGLFE